MYHQRLSDKAIINGFRRFLPFYGYCQAGYYICDQRYEQSEKENQDFMSPAHQYAIYLMEHNWKPLVNDSPSVSHEDVAWRPLVARLGCGIAGYTDEEISPLFAEAHGVENIVLPPNW